MEELRNNWARAGGGAKAAAKLDGGKHLLPEWDEDHNDACVVCDTGGTLLCCDFCNIAQHPKCCIPPMKTVTQARYWACEECTEDMWCDYAGLRRKFARPTDRSDGLIALCFCFWGGFVGFL